MTKTTRRIIFYFLCVVFLIATPLVIFYAEGLTFDWENQQIVKTGGLYLKSLPQKADIFIDGAKEAQTPFLFSHLLPKNYQVKIELKGFHSWGKNLEVKPELVTEARNIFLFPQNPSSEFIAQNVTSTIPAFLNSIEKNKKENQAQKIASSSAAWVLKNNEIYFISEINFNLYRTDLNSFFREQISKEPLSENGNFKIFVGPAQNQIAVLSPKNKLYFLNKGSKIFELLSPSVRQAQFSDDGKKLLFFSDYEVWALYLEDFLIQPYKKAGEKELITRFAQKISQAIFFPDNEHLALVIGDKIKVIELDGRDQRNFIDFLTVPSPEIFYDSRNEYFYYLTQQKLFRIEIEK